MADLAKARRILTDALTSLAPDDARPREIRADQLRDALDAIPAEPTDLAPLAVLSDFLADHGASALIGPTEDPVRELLALREAVIQVRKERAVMPASPPSVDYRNETATKTLVRREGWRVTVTYMGREFSATRHEASLAMALALRQLATGIDVRCDLGDDYFRPVGVALNGARRGEMVEMQLGGTARPASNAARQAARLLNERLEAYAVEAPRTAVQMVDRRNELMAEILDTVRYDQQTEAHAAMLGSPTPPQPGWAALHQTGGTGIPPRPPSRLGVAGESLPAGVLVGIDLAAGPDQAVFAVRHPDGQLDIVADSGEQRLTVGEPLINLDGSIDRMRCIPLPVDDEKAD